MTGHPTHRAARGLLLVALLTLGAAGCGGSDHPASAGAPTTTSTAPPEPLNIVVGGDSVIYDGAPGLAAALDPAVANVDAIVTPVIDKPAARAQLAAAVDGAKAEVTIVMVGIWERVYTSTTGLHLHDPGFEEAYRAEVLDPLLAALAPSGTRLVLVREPPMWEASTEADLVALGAIWSRFAADHAESTSYLDSSPWFDSSTDEVLPLDGAPARTRRVDRIHLCAAGAVRMADGLLDALPTVVDRPWTPVTVPGWQTGAWTSRFPADECPPLP